MEKVISFFRRSAHILSPFLWVIIILFLLYAPLNLFLRTVITLSLVYSAFYYLEFWHKSSKLYELERAIYLIDLKDKFIEKLDDKDELDDYVWKLVGAKNEGKKHLDLEVINDQLRWRDKEFFKHFESFIRLAGIITLLLMLINTPDNILILAVIFLFFTAIMAAKFMAYDKDKFPRD